jgi:antitoxin component of MazEF toxin-antitoxin module
METESVIRKFGGSLYLLIPSHMLSWLDIEDGDAMVIADKDKGKGRFIAAWKDAKKK